MIWIQILIPPLLVALLATIGVLMARMRKMEISISELQVKVSPFWASIQSKVADALHQPDIQHAVTDDLLEKLVMGKATDIEKDKLKRTLKAMVSTAPTDIAEKAQVLLTVMPLVEQETAGMIPHTDERSMDQKKT